MNLVFKFGLNSFIIAAAMSASVFVFAQSGTRAPAASRPTSGSGTTVKDAASGSSTRTEQESVGLHGYCPVCLVEMRQWVKGDPKIAAEYDGRKYIFPSAEQLEMFRKDPAKYVPVLGGDDIVAYATTGKRIDGEPTYGVVQDGRYYFFASQENMQTFKSSPETYADADLALGGECIVCRVDMNQRVAGSPTVVTTHKGIRYQFPGEEQKAMFTRSPDRYVDALRGTTAAGPSGSRTRPGSATSQPSQPAGGSGSR
jgi:YHS domain-containing protein